MFLLRGEVGERSNATYQMIGYRSAFITGNQVKISLHAYPSGH